MEIWIYSVHHYSGNPTVSLMTIASKNPSRIRILMRLVKSIQNLMDFFLVSPSSHEPPPLPRFGKYIYGEKSAMKFWSVLDSCQTYEWFAGPKLHCADLVRETRLQLETQRWCTTDCTPEIGCHRIERYRPQQLDWN